MPLALADLDDTDFAVAEEERRRLARNGILPFTVYTKDDYRINWHHRLIASKLDQFVKGEIKRLLISLPPQAGGKSELISRRLPAYIFGKRPQSKIIAGSYTIDLIRSMSRKCQSIIQSDEYQELFPDVKIKIGDLKGTADEWETSLGGSYKGVGVEGGVNGRPGDFALLDDLIKGRQEANSPTIRNRVWGFLQDDILTRIGAHGGCLIVATRWHDEDPTGMLLTLMEKDPNADQWDTLFIPARLDREEDRVPGDVRNIGDALWPWYYAGKNDSLSQAEQEAKANDFLSKWESRNPLGFASLAQQRPTPLKGDMFNREWFRFIDRSELPAGMRLVRYWDRAATTPSPSNPNPDWTAGALCGEHDGRLFIVDMEHFQGDSDDNEKRIHRCAVEDGYNVSIHLEEEGGSSGKDAIHNYQRRILKGWTVVGDRPSGDKVVRANPWSALAKNGNVILVRGSWNRAFLAEAVTFPNGKKDQIDAVSGAYKTLFQSFEVGDEDSPV